MMSTWVSDGDRNSPLGPMPRQIPPRGERAPREPPWSPARPRPARGCRRVSRGVKGKPALVRAGRLQWTRVGGGRVERVTLRARHQLRHKHEAPSGDFRGGFDVSDPIRPQITQIAQISPGASCKSFSALGSWLSMSPAASHATSISRSLLDQNDSVSILVTGIVSDHLNREPIRADRGKDINAACFHRRACVVRSNALLQTARLT